MATAQGENDFPDSKMYSFASHHGVWLDYRFKSYVDENTEWTAYGPNVPASAAGKKFTLKENFLSAEKVTLIYSALNSIDKHKVQMWFYDTHWDTEFKNLEYFYFHNFTTFVSKIMYLFDFTSSYILKYC